jgi:N-acetylneuraminic acid mutarotase
MIVWGGGSNTGGVYDPGTNSWSATSTVGAPSARSGQTAVWTGTRMLVFGGNNFDSSGGSYDPVTNTWTALSLTDAPSGRLGHSAVWTGTRMIIWGGSDATGTSLNTGAVYSPVTDSWTATTLTGAPAHRSLHSAIWTGSRMVIWGGFTPISFSSSNTGARYDPIANSWTATSVVAATPTAREHHGTIWTGTKMVIFGGTTAGTPFGVGGIYQ